jgi:hypothetical protein
MWRYAANFNASTIKTSWRTRPNVCIFGKIFSNHYHRLARNFWTHNCRRLSETQDPKQIQGFPLLACTGGCLPTERDARSMTNASVQMHGQTGVRVYSSTIKRAGKGIDTCLLCTRERLRACMCWPVFSQGPACRRTRTCTRASVFASACVCLRKHVCNFFNACTPICLSSKL